MFKHKKKYIYFIVRVVKHWSRLAREAVVSPLLEILRTLRTLLDTVLGNLFWLTFL